MEMIQELLIIELILMDVHSYTCKSHVMYIKIQIRKIYYIKRLSKAK